jgi:hypothetical protein
MPCLVALLFLMFPRVALVLLWLFSNYLEHAYHGILLPLLGFLFLPLTTLVYAYMINNGVPTNGFNLVWLVLAVLIDLGAMGHGYRNRRRR